MWIEVKPGEFAMTTRITFHPETGIATCWFGPYQNCQLDAERSQLLRNLLDLEETVFIDEAGREVDIHG